MSINSFAGFASKFSTISIDTPESSIQKSRILSITFGTYAFHRKQSRTKLIDFDLLTLLIMNKPTSRNVVSPIFTINWQMNVILGSLNLHALINCRQFIQFRKTLSFNFKFNLKML